MVNHIRYINFPSASVLDTNKTMENTRNEFVDMEVPVETVKICKSYLTRIQTEHDFDFKPIHRAEICRSFGPSGIKHFWDWDKSIRRIQMSPADKAYGWLGVLTAKKVKPVWENAELQDFDSDEIHYLPSQMLELAAGILNGTDDADKINDFSWTSTWNFERTTRKNIYSAMASARAALNTLLHGVAGLSGDSATPALTAYACVDLNPPGAWFGEIMGFDFYKKLQNDENLEFIPIEIDRQKAVEFWEWWLEEAIPHAWE